MELTCLAPEQREALATTTASVLNALLNDDILDDAGQAAAITATSAIIAALINNGRL